MHPQPSPGPMASGGQPPGAAIAVTERGSSASGWTQWVCAAQPKPGWACMVTKVLGALQLSMEMLMAGRTLSVLPLVHLSGQEGSGGMDGASHQDSAPHWKE